jgi:hypothetical protein
MNEHRGGDVMARFLRHLLWRYKWWRIKRDNPRLKPSDWAISFMQWAEVYYDMDPWEVLTSNAMMWTLDQIVREHER